MKINYPIVKLTLILLGITGVTTAFSQSQEFTVSTAWNSQRNKCFPCDFDEEHQKVFTSKTFELAVRGNFDHSYDLVSVRYKDVEIPSQFDKKYIPEDIDLKVDFGNARLQNYVSVYFYPIVRVNGEIKLVDEVTIETTSVPAVGSGERAATFASNSVLNTGTWYKIGVSRTGIHKIDQAYLNSIGVTTAGLNPNDINIYGNHLAQYPINNSTYRPDDLLKNAIYIEGDGDNSFDAADYILFYATGPEVMTYNVNTINERKNNNDSLNYYFIHIDAADTPKRVGSQPSSANTVTHPTTTFNDVTTYENNDVNLIKSGTVWLGEFYDLELSKILSAGLIDINTSTPVELQTSIASNVQSGTSANFVIAINGTQVDDISLSTFSGSYNEAMVNNSTVTFSATSGSLSIGTTLNRTSPASVAWLDYMIFNYRRNASLGTEQIQIRDLLSVGNGNVTEYTVASANTSSFFWEVTDPSNATAIQGVLSGSNFTFALDSDSLRHIAAFNASQAYIPTYIGEVQNQDLHALTQCDYVIVTTAELMPQAQRLADLHIGLGESVHVVDIQQVYNEFSGGVADPVSVRWLMKMFYDRAGGDVNLMPDHLCMFGDGTYDPLNRLPNNNAILPTYNYSVIDNDIDYVESYTSDDFFGILDDNEAMSPANMLDIGVGRIPVDNLSSAEDVVNKVEHYMNFGSYLYGDAEGIQCDENGYSSSFGDWRIRTVLMADDEDWGTFVDDCEDLSDTTEKLNPEMNIVKIYLDAYQQIITSGGQRYPDVEEAINQNINKGALVFNYVGHGGETGLTLERAVTINMIENWQNVNNMCIFVSATCEFTRFDDPGRVSAGERTLVTPFGGAVGLLTTTRLVYISLNSELVRKLYTQLFAEENGKPLTLGEITRRTKNLTSATDNKRNFCVVGDPALVLGKPQPRIVTDSINGIPITAATDSLKALSTITISGHVGDVNGAVIGNYNGIVYPTVFDKWKTKYTLGQDPKSPVEPFDIQNNIIYKGKATVTNGNFQFSFVVPKDIDYSFGKGKISYYSNDANSNSYGFDTSIVVGGVDPNGINDNVGPSVMLYMNDPNFVNGGMTNESPLFIAEVNDENGVNTTGNGIGHDVTLTIDGNTAEPIILNNFYEADLDTYQSGKVSYQLSELEPGNHTATFKVWDVNNNSSEATLEFVVVEDEEIGISHLLNYPNPFTTNTDFFFEHNQVCSSLDVKIEIFTVSGKLVKTLLETVNTVAFRAEAVNWDGRDEYGDRLGRGVYVYRLSIETPDGKKAEKLEKLVIL